ncbi:MAG: hypothetical protein JFAIHJKO_01590 [Pyrinomonadaceae bacterium]|nr:hypothetical protein [Pyrinomonadaceae bacterium]
MSQAMGSCRINWMLNEKHRKTAAFTAECENYAVDCYLCSYV